MRTCGGFLFGTFLLCLVGYSQTADRVVLFGQPALEMVKRFGGKENVVGVGYLDRKSKKGEEIGWPILTSLWPSIESIIQTRPTHLFGMESAFKDKRSGSPSFWQEKNIKVIPVFDFNQPRTLSVFFRDLEAFGTVFHKEKEVKQFIEQETQKITQLKAKVAKTSKAKEKRVLFLANVRSSDIFYCYTQDKCIIGSLLEDFNVTFLTSETMVIPISLEYLVRLNPDYLILSSFQANSLPELLRYFQGHPVLKRLDAVKNKRLITVDYSNAVSGGLEFVALYEQLIHLLYPE